MSDASARASVHGWRIPAAWFGLLWTASLVVCAPRGETSVLLWGPAVLGGVALFVWLVVRVTANATPDDAVPATPGDRPRLCLQFAWLLAVVAITGWRGLVFHGLAHGAVPGFDALVGEAGDLGAHLLPAAWVGDPRNALANPIAYLLVPLAGLLLLGARLRSLGFGRGHRVFVVVAVTCALPALWIAAHLPSPQRLVAVLASNTLQNGPFEEFLFRGALMTRLLPLVGRPWAVVVQAVLFGLWHVGAAAHGSDGGAMAFTAAAAQTIVGQATAGLLFGVVALRTNNLWAGSLLHVLSNSAAELG